MTRVATAGEHREADVKVVDIDVTEHHAGTQPPLWKATISTRLWKSLTVSTHLAGAHNIANIAEVVCLIELLAIDGKLRKEPKAQDLMAAIASFAGVKRRLDLLGRVGGIDIYEDFAHHPTAIAAVINGFRRMYPQKRVVVAFEQQTQLDVETFCSMTLRSLCNMLIGSFLVSVLRSQNSGKGAHEHSSHGSRDWRAKGTGISRNEDLLLG